MTENEINEVEAVAGDAADIAENFELQTEVLSADAETEGNDHEESCDCEKCDPTGEDESEEVTVEDIEPTQEV
jgi:hypothetical protein